MGSEKFIALSGGVGGAKLSQGLASIIPAEDLTIVVNTGDDADHYGLFVCPDIDTQIYTLSGRADPDRGWGRRDESWHAMNVMRELGEDVWFNIGDHDLGLKMLRTMRLARGDRLTDITRDFARRFGLYETILPMSDERVSTHIRCADGWYGFHEWFVEAKCVPKVEEIVFKGAGSATMTEEARAAFADPQLSAVIVCPSNPFLSIDPILSVPGMREAISECDVPVIGVTPVVGGEAIKGPTAAMMRGFDMPVTAGSAAAVHKGLYSGYVIDARDEDQVNDFKNANADLAVTAHDTMMVDLAAKESLARAVVNFAQTLGER